MEARQTCTEATTASAHTGRLDNGFNKHRPGQSNPGHCCVCSVGGVK